MLGTRMSNNGFVQTLPSTIMTAAIGRKYCSGDTTEMVFKIDSTTIPDFDESQSCEHRPDDDRRRIIHIFGCPNSGKTTLRRNLSKRHPDYPNYCIDDFRRRYGDGTFEGEIDAQIRFGHAMMDGGFFECSGSGRFTEYNLSANRYRPQYIVVMDASAEVCISRITEGKYNGIPFPFTDSNEDFIRSVSIFLSSERFARIRRGIPTLWLETDIPLNEQTEKVEKFTGLDSP